MHGLPLLFIWLLVYRTDLLSGCTIFKTPFLSHPSSLGHPLLLLILTASDMLSSCPLLFNPFPPSPRCLHLPLPPSATNVFFTCTLWTLFYFHVINSSWKRAPKSGLESSPFCWLYPNMSPSLSIVCFRLPQFISFDLFILCVSDTLETDCPQRDFPF